MHWHEGGDRLELGIQTFPGREPNDHVLWVESHRAVISGDTLADLGSGLEINKRWLRENRTREMVLAYLEPLRSLPVEYVLATHGGPFSPADLERALA